ncbi:molybdate ABC transporter substrate-binding protein [Shinella granuli]|uniref:Molybdate transport system substrate-binding protein n=1 Tax=Shinella granuli TaxID=323621 RepID=A0A4R2D4C7_SHIGR|nr:molybdate ABC transporter substrate-binding protein [Shinella granuli]TCN48751.1 molybdate transport system substrate-binding protein [Shinella granuli]
MAEPVRILAAGSLRHALPDIAAAFEETTGIPVSLSLGPAGLLRERIEAGDPFDLFASANMAHPRHLVSIGLAKEAICFARNRLVILARAGLGLTMENLVTVLSAPSTRIGTSTPGDDPSGDYAFEMFDRLEICHPGLGDALKTRALQLVGGRHTPAGRSAAALIAGGAVDLFLGYASNARLHEKDPDLGIVDIPPEYSPNIEYGLVLRNGAADEAVALRDFLMSDHAEQLLVRHGFESRVGAGP